jgi:hypothetical protein
MTTNRPFRPSPELLARAMQSRISVPSTVLKQNMLDSLTIVAPGMEPSEKVRIAESVAPKPTVLVRDTGRELKDFLLTTLKTFAPQIAEPDIERIADIAVTATVADSKTRHL